MFDVESVMSQVVDAWCEESTIAHDQELEGLYDKARKGNPFPLIAYQWPSLLVDDPAEQQFFQGDPNDPNDPCLRLDDWQREHILKPFFDPAIYEIAIKGNTKPGKGASVAIAVNLWFECYDPAKIILTSTTHQHAKNVIFAEVVKWRRIMTHPGKSTRVLIKNIKDSEQHYVEISNPKTGEGFSGQHGPATLFVFDEATGIPDRFYEDAGKQARKIVAIGNPRTLSGWFYKLFRDCKDRNKTQVIPAAMGQRMCVTVGGQDCMNVRHQRLEVPIAPPGGITIRGRRFESSERLPDSYFAKVKPLIPNQVDYSRYLAIKSHPDPRHVAVFAHGHFPSEDPEKQVILPSWLPRHVEAHKDGWHKIKVQAMGLDVARSLDGDETILTYGGEKGILGIEGRHYDNVPNITQWVLEWTLEALSIDLKEGQIPICVDMIYAPGVGDLLKEAGVWVMEFRGNDRSTVDPKTFVNRRCESYATLGRRLSPDDRWRDEPFMIPDDGQLHEELCAPEKDYQGGDRFRYKLNPKDEIKKSIGRSPDKGDSAVFFFDALREVLDINALFRVWENVKIVKDPSEDEVKEMREIIDDDDSDPGSLGPKKDWATGLSFAREPAQLDE